LGAYAAIARGLLQKMLQARLLADHVGVVFKSDRSRGVDKRYGCVS
jgi:hypothetical protein